MCVCVVDEHDGGDADHDGDADEDGDDVNFSDTAWISPGRLSR